jgi:hypothetical protein
VQKEIEIAAALDTRRKEGYILSCQEWVEAARSEVDIAGGVSSQLLKLFISDADTKSATTPAITSAIHIPREITALQSDS